jgi:PBSX family phage terminase large subunit
MNLLSHQADFIESDYIHTALVGGFRSGKSFSGCLKTVLKKLSYPNINVAYYLPTYGLIKDIAYPLLSQLLSDLKIEFQLNKSDHEYLTAYGKIILRSLDNPDTIIGYEVGYSCIDEADVLSKQHMKDAFVKVVSRLSKPLPDGKKNSLDFVSTPEGFKFLYEFFVKEANENKLLIKATTSDNPFISDSYIDTLRMSYSPQQLDAYLNGEFVNLTSGTVYHRFSREINLCNREINSNDILHIGMDFNVTKMNAVVHTIEGENLYAVAEIVNAFDTNDVCQKIKTLYPNFRIIVYPDASGNNRRSSGKSDIDIIRSFGFAIRKPTKNPFVKDRVTAVNMAFRNSFDKTRYFINQNNCPTLLEAFESQAYKNGEPDKSNGYDHITEAAGYFICQQTKKKPMPL